MTARIGLITPRFAPSIGGVETHVARLATHLKERGHDIHILTQSHDHTLPSVETMNGIRVHRFPVVSLPRSQNFVVAPGLWAYIACHGARYDLLHAHSYHALPALGSVLARRCPVVFTPHYHGTGHARVRRLLHRPYRLLGTEIFRRASAVICVSAAEASLVKQHFPWVTDRISIIPNGVDTAALIAAQPFARRERIILSVGRLEEYKRVDRTITALAHLDREFVLFIVGDGPTRRRLEMLTASLGLRDRVTFLGQASDADLRRWFRTATVYVSMSGHEAFGITLFEALAAGGGIVASDIPAHREVAAAAGGHVKLVGAHATPMALAALMREAAEGQAQTSSLPDIPRWAAVVERTEAIYFSAIHAAISHV